MFGSTTRKLALVAAATVALGLVAPSAQAATWTKTASTTQNAYSWNAYRAKVTPSRPRPCRATRCTRRR